MVNWAVPVVLEMAAVTKAWCCPGGIKREMAVRSCGMERGDASAMTIVVRLHPLPIPKCRTQYSMSSPVLAPTSMTAGLGPDPHEPAQVRGICVGLLWAEYSICSTTVRPQFLLAASMGTTFPHRNWRNNSSCAHRTLRASIALSRENLSPRYLFQYSIERVLQSRTSAPEGRNRSATQINDKQAAGMGAILLILRNRS